jgi:hypothetical protein
MSTTNTGGPAFPYPFYDEKGHCIDGIEGMAMRDYFAAKAMQGLMGRSWADTSGKFPENLHDVWATAAYQMADAMLKAREV